jgi:hypothetical protein
MTLGVGRERGLSRAAEAEEPRRGAGLFVRRGRAVHREHAALRREVVRNRKDAFLHLAGSSCSPINQAYIDAQDRVSALWRDPHAGRASRSSTARAWAILLRPLDPRLRPARMEGVTWTS